MADGIPKDGFAVGEPLPVGRAGAGLSPALEKAARYPLDLANAFNREAEDGSLRGPFHPVLIFGTGASGKSLALASLLRYARQNTSACIRPELQDFDYPDSCPNPGELRKFARELYDGEVTQFQSDSSHKVAATRRGYPFFVPIEAVFRRGRADAADKGEMVRFAFLESEGEWIHKGADGYSFQPLRPEISAIFEHFSYPLSVIFVVPATTDNVLDEVRVKESHECAAHCMDEYRKQRKRKEKDNLLLLVSKWDALHPPDGFNADHFANPTSKLVTEAIGKYPWSWSQFAKMVEVPPEARALTPYAATWIRNGVRTDEGPFKPTFERFNQTIWNWLYGNVFSIAGERKHFFADVTPAGPPGGRRYRSVMRRTMSLVGV